MMMEDGKLFNRKREQYIFNNKYVIPLKIFGLYCAVVWRRGGNACIDVGVGSDG
jgi:hypothetical protein